MGGCYKVRYHVFIKRSTGHYISIMPLNSLVFCFITIARFGSSLKVGILKVFIALRY